MHTGSNISNLKRLFHPGNIDYVKNMCRLFINVYLHKHTCMISRQKSKNVQIFEKLLPVVTFACHIILLIYSIWKQKTCPKSLQVKLTGSTGETRLKTSTSWSLYYFSDR